VIILPRRRKSTQEFPAAWGEPGGPFPIPSVPDDQWQTIAKLSAISVKSTQARREFEDVIAKYRRWEINDRARLSSTDLQIGLTALRAGVLELLGRLKNIDIQFALAMTKAPARKSGASRTIKRGLDRRLDTVLTELQYLADWLERALSLVPNEKRGRRTENVYWLVAELDLIRERFTGLMITRSYKDDASRAFIAGVCRIANPKIGKGTIDAAMKDRIARRGRNSR
jgi:hypothetical protein